MVLQELGTRITKALRCMSNATIVDEKVLTECLNEISRALLEADVQLKLVATLQGHIKKSVNLNGLASGLNKRKIIQQVRKTLFFTFLIMPFELLHFHYLFFILKI